MFLYETGILPSLSHSQAAANEPIIDDLIRDFDFFNTKLE